MALNTSPCWEQSWGLCKQSCWTRLPFPRTIRTSLRFGSHAATRAVSYHEETALCWKALQNKADNIFWDGALYFPRAVSLQQLLQESKPNPPICKSERKSTTQTGIWFRTVWFTQRLRSILDKSKLSAKNSRGKRTFLLCCLNAVRNQADKIAWHCCPLWNKPCVSFFTSTAQFVFILPSLAFAALP